MQTNPSINFQNMHWNTTNPTRFSIDQAYRDRWTDAITKKIRAIRYSAEEFNKFVSLVKRYEESVLANVTTIEDYDRIMALKLAHISAIVARARLRHQHKLMDAQKAAAGMTESVNR